MVVYAICNLLAATPGLALGSLENIDEKAERSRAELSSFYTLGLRLLVIYSRGRSGLHGPRGMLLTLFFLKCLF